MFVNDATDQMEVLVELCGGTVVKDPLMFSKKVPSFVLLFHITAYIYIYISLYLCVCVCFRVSVISWWWSSLALKTLSRITQVSKSAPLLL